MSQPSDSPTLSGRAVLITGASRGIGYACAEACLRAGASVFLCSRQARPLEAAAERLRALGLGSVGLQAADISEPLQVERLFAAAQDQMQALNGLIHAAAVLGAIGPLGDTDPLAWAEVVRVDLIGTYLVLRAACRAMPPGSRGVVLSGGGATAPFPHYSAYAASKAGVVRLVETVAQELPPGGLELNALAPGFVATGIHDATLAAGERAGGEYLLHTKKMLVEGAVPASVAAAAAVFLLSARAAGITGKLVAAVHDDWKHWPDRLEVIRDSELFTLRRIVPRDRGETWQ